MIVFLIIGSFLAYAIIGIVLSLIFEIVCIKKIGDSMIDDMRILNMIFWPVISPYRFGHLMIEYYYRKNTRRYISDLDEAKYELRVALHKINFIRDKLIQSRMDTRFIDEFKYIQK